MVFHSGTALPPGMKPFADKKTKNMKTEIIQSLTDDFESYARQMENAVEFWLARDLQCLLGYTDWRNFLQVLNRAKVACEVSEHRIIDHFVDANKMVSLGSGSQRDLPPDEDVKKVERNLQSDEKRELKNPKSLDSD